MECSGLAERDEERYLPSNKAAYKRAYGKDPATAAERSEAAALGLQSNSSPAPKIGGMSDVVIGAKEAYAKNGMLGITLDQRQTLEDTLLTPDDPNWDAYPELQTVGAELAKFKKQEKQITSDLASWDKKAEAAFVKKYKRSPTTDSEVAHSEQLAGMPDYSRSNGEPETTNAAVIRIMQATAGDRNDP